MPLLLPCVELAEPPAVSGVDEDFLQLHRQGREDDLDERRLAVSAQLHVYRALLVAESAHPEDEQTGGIVPECKPSIGAGHDLAPDCADLDQGHLRLGN